MTLVTLEPIQPDEDITADSGNRQPAAIAAVLNGQVDDSNISGVSGSKVANGTITPTKWTNPYTFLAYRSGAWTTNGISLAKVTLDTEVFDTNSDFNTTLGRYVAPVAGVYHFDYIGSAAVAAGNYYNAALYVNGSLQSTGNSAVSYNTFTHKSSGSATLKLNAGDYVELYFRGSGAAGDTGVSSTSLGGYLVAAS